MRALLTTLLFVALTQTASADVTAQNMWARATPPGSTVAVVYGELISDQSDELISISTPAAERAEVHTTLHEGGTMKMRPMTAVAIPAKTPIRFRSGGMHVMLVGLRAPLTAGSTIEVTFRFRTAPELIVSAKVLAPGAMETSR
jgi:periplasmic copper chaperone A